MIVPQRGYTEHLAYRCVPRDVPEPPSTANDHHQQQPTSMKLVQALSLRATHENTLVMRSSPGLELAKPITVCPWPGCGNLAIDTSRAMPRLAVFKSFGGSCPDIAATWPIGARALLAKHDHPAYIPGSGPRGWQRASGA